MRPIAEGIGGIYDDVYVVRAVRQARKNKISISLPKMSVCELSNINRQLETLSVDLVARIHSLDVGVLRGIVLGSGRNRSVELDGEELSGTGEPKSKKKITLDKVCRVVADCCDVTLEELKKVTNRRDVVERRSVAMYVAHVLCGFEYAMIGQYFRGKHHTTVLHACRSIELKKNNDRVLALLERVKAILGRSDLGLSTHVAT